MKKSYYVLAIIVFISAVLFIGMRDDHAVMSDDNALPEIRLPNQFFQMHPHEHLNFQLNRLLTCVGMNNLEEIQQVAGNIHNLADWKTELIKLAEKARAEQRLFEAAFYYRFAEFFISPDDPDKTTVYHEYLNLVNRVYAGFPVERHKVPYQGSYLKAVKATVPDARGLIVLCGGFDSYMEEFFPVLSTYRKSGYSVIAFEGPGQGESLHTFGHVMTHEWEKPTAAVLDYFKADDVTLIGVSLGGYLAVRAAAFEPRVKRVVAMDIMYDFLECFTSRAGAVKGRLMKPGLALKLKPVVNYFAGRQMENDMMAEWGISHGMMVMGAESPYDFLQKVRLYNTRDISRLVTQDVLLLAGKEDHMVPLKQFDRQKKALTRAASVTGRIFTAEEQAQNHCQVGNMKLAIDTIMEWLNAHHQQAI